MLEHLFVVPMGGLCNRISVIASAKRLCAINQIRCTMLWDWGNYNSLFAREPTLDFLNPKSFNSSGIHLIKHRRPHKGGNPTNWRIPISTHQKIVLRSRYVFCAVEEPGSITHKDLERWLPKPTDLILSKVAAFKNSYFGKTVGMHIRRTDHKPATETTPDEVCVNVARQHIEKEYSIFLATDNFDTEKMMRAYFGKKIIIYPKNPSLKIRWPRSQFVFEETMDDLVDLHLLAACEFVLGSRLSTYSLMAMSYNGSPDCKWIAPDNPLQLSDEIGSYPC